MYRNQPTEGAMLSYAYQRKGQVASQKPYREHVYQSTGNVSEAFF
jgi:hypothetical protein